MFSRCEETGELASDLSLAVMRLARQLRFRRPESPVTLSQLSALATLAKEGAMTPGALAVRERVRPPSMTRVVASLVDLGLVVRAAHPADGRQILVAAVPCRAPSWWNANVGPARTGCACGWPPWTPRSATSCCEAADLMTVLVDEDA